MFSTPIFNAEAFNSRMKQVPSRYYGLDALRTGMLLLGIVLHLSLPYDGFTLPGYFVTNERSRALQFFLILHYFRMPLFFLISGFFSGLIWKRGGNRELLRIRSQRIGLVWIGSLAILSPVMAVISIYNHFASKGGNALIPTWQAISSFRIDRSWLQNAAIHLWFLEYLMLYCLITVVILSINKNFSPTLDYWAGKVIRSKSRVFVLAIPTAAMLWYMPYAVMPYPSSLVPWLGVSLTYGWFYTVGWLMYRQRGELSFMASRARFEKLTAPILIVICLILLKKRFHVASGTSTLLLDLELTFSTALFIWTTIIALIATFYYTRPNKWLPYLADSSYWMYLMHYPFAVVMPAVLRNWPVSPLIKVGFSLLSIFFILLLTYSRFVRYTVIGQALHGNKSRANASCPEERRGALAL